MSAYRPSVLAIKWRALGDTVLWSSSLAALRSFLPHSKIDLVLPRNYTPLFDSDSRFENVYGLEKGVWNNRTWLRQFRKQQYDYCLVFHASQNSRWFARYVGAKKTLIHHHSRTPKKFSSDVAIVNAGVPMPANERDLNVIRTLGWQGSMPPIELYPSEKALAWARIRLKEMGWNSARPLVILGAVASRPSKMWQSERYLSLVEQLSKGATCVFVCPSQLHFSSWFRNHIPEVGGQVLETPELFQLMGVLSLATCFVGSDSGAKHLACALGAKTVTLFGPESMGEWHCYEPSSHLGIQKKVACRSENLEDPKFSWCKQETCPLGSHACLNLISVEEVFKAVSRFL